MWRHAFTWYLITFFLVAVFAPIAFAAEVSGTKVSGTKILPLARISPFSPDRSLPIQVPADPDIQSPKSARFSADGKKLYINSLEGGKTVVYAWPSLQKLRVISHSFGPEATTELFQGERDYFDYPFYARPGSGDVNVFVGKPVESELSHNGRYMWIPYYRRSYDSYGQSPSAVAIVDTSTDQIVRVMPTGPIPKYVAASADGRYVAVTHWGDNTIGLIDTSSGDPRSFRYVARLTVESRMSQAGLAGRDRDAACGFCLRGTVFTSDSRTLLVARMGGGGIAGFDVASATYLGSVMAVAATPRHLALSPDGETLYVSSNSSGAVSKASVASVVRALEGAQGRRIAGPGFQSVVVGSGARTLGVSPNGQFLFVALNNPSQLAVVESSTLKVVARSAIAAFAVGLAVAPELFQNADAAVSAVVLTSQGRAGRGGGNTVSIVGVTHLSVQDRGLEIRKQD